MTDINISLSGVESLELTAPNVRIATSGVEVLERHGTSIRIAQAGVEVLFRYLTPIYVAQSGVEILHKAVPCTSEFIQVWRIVRTDGETLRLTSRDTNVIFKDEVYSGCSSIFPSASETASGVNEVGSMDLTGIIRDGLITVEEIHAGLYDGATIEAYLIDYATGEVKEVLLEGTFSNVDYDEDGYTVEIMGDGARLEQTPIVNKIEPDCRWTFGDQFCTKDLGPLTVSGAVEAVGSKRGFIDTSRVETTGYFTRGHVTFTSGANAGISAEIKEHADNGVFVLWPKLAFPLEVGDTYDMVPGCTNLKEDVGGCQGCDSWANFDFYGGFRNVPGGDKASAQPDVRKF